MPIFDTGAQLASKLSMANALRRLDSDSPSAGLPANLAAMGMRNTNSWLSIFSTHPPIAERIKALEQNQ